MHSQTKAAGDEFDVCLVYKFVNEVVAGVVYY